jgi:hypothetical protein
MRSATPSTGTLFSKGFSSGVRSVPLEGVADRCPEPDARSRDPWTRTGIGIGIGIGTGTG